MTVGHVSVINTGYQWCRVNVFHCLRKTKIGHFTVYSFGFFFLCFNWQDHLSMCVQHWDRALCFSTAEFSKVAWRGERLEDGWRISWDCVVFHDRVKPGYGRETESNPVSQSKPYVCGRAWATQQASGLGRKVMTCQVLPGKTKKKNTCNSLIQQKKI